MLRIGLDRDAGAVVLASADSGGELDAMTAACRPNGATEVLATEDPGEAEYLIVARRQAVPTVERLGRLLLEDVGVPVPRLPAPVDGIGAIAGRHGITIALTAHAGDGNTPRGDGAVRSDQGRLDPLWILNPGAVFPAAMTLQPTPHT